MFFFRYFFRVLDDARIQHNSRKFTFLKAAIISPEDPTVGYPAHRRKNIANIMIPCNVISQNRGILFAHDTEILRNLCTISCLVDEIARHDHKHRAKAICIGDGELQLRRLLLENLIVAVHRIENLSSEWKNHPGPG